MPFDNYVMGAVAHELNNTLVGGKIDRIYQPTASDILLGVNVPNLRERYALLISANSSLPRIYLSKLAAANPQHPPAFCMLLRKRIGGGRISAVTAVPAERILFIEITAQNELGVSANCSLIFELMGKHSNIILTQKDAAGADIIADSLKRIYPDISRVRQILPRLEYELPPPSQGTSPLIRDELAGGGNPSRFDSLAQAGEYSPRIWFADSNAMRDFHVFPINLYESLSCKDFDSVSEMLETWYEGKETGNRLRQKSADILKALQSRTEKALLKKQRLLEDIEKAEKADTYRLKGDLITANIYRLEKGMKTALLEDYASGEEVSISLDETLTPAQNAQRYYKKYSKAKTAKKAKHGQLSITEREISYLESYLLWLEDAKTDAEIDSLREELTEQGYIKKRKQGSRPSSVSAKKLSYEVNGFTVTVGRNNKENDSLTTKNAKPYDLWLHTKDIPGSHVVISAKGNENTQQSADPADVYGADTIRRAASIAAYYSKGRESSNVPVDYTYIRYVKKPSGAKLGMVIFTHNRTVYAEPTLPPSETSIS